MDLKKRIQRILESHEEVVAAYIYGSVARGQEREESDIDLGLLLRDDFVPDGLYPARLAEEIARGCGLRQEVDIRTLNGMPLTFLHQVLRHGVLVFTRDDRRRAEFETRVYDMYLDYKPHFDQFNEVRRRRLLA